MHPRAWERQVHPTLLTMPDIHPLIDAEYAPYDIGVMGELDVRILTELFAGKAERGATDAGVGRRHLLRGAEPRGEDAGGEGLDEIGGAAVPVAVEERGGCGALCGDLCGQPEAEVHGRAPAAEG